MTNKSRLLLGLLMATPGWAYALGLGDIKLGSGLNQPLVAEIELVGATQEELQQLRAGLASRESFERYGIDRPQFLSTLQFRVAKDGSGRNVLEVRSADVITEPFVTFLVEVNWPRGRLIREYTVLLDPPVFEEQPSVAPPLAAPRTGETAAPAAGAVTRTPAPAPAPAPVVEAPPAPAVAERPSAPLVGGEYTVVAGDTLSGIARAQGAATRGEVNRLMIAIYRANPGAFAGNINRLNRGAVLRIPGSADLDAVSAGEAAAEVRRQMAEWRGSTADGAAGVGEPARLRLVTPSEPVDGVGTAPAPAPAPAAGTATQPAATAAEQKAADAKRLLELKNEELARLQATQPAAGTATPAAPAPADPAATASATTDPAAPPTPAAEPAAAKPVAPPARKPAPPVEEPGLFATLMDNLPLFGGGALLLLLAGLFGSRYLKKKRESETEDTFRTLDRGGDDAGALPTLSATSRLSREDHERTNILVEESDDDSGEFQAPPMAGNAPRTALRPEPEPRHEDTLSSETALNLEQADPLAEADFHMAYGLYDQAADIVKLAIGREPDRRDLKLKLLEVYFVWGNQESFLEVARELGRTRGEGTAGEWEKVAIMGRQIAGDDPLFAGSTGRATDVDLDLEAGGQEGVDLELLGEPDADLRPARLARGGDVDLDLGSALGGTSLDDTGEAQRLDESALDLVLDGPGSGARDATVEQPTLRVGNTTREMRPRVDAPTVEQPGLGRSFGGDSPTVESPALASGNTIREKIDSALFRREQPSPESTAELSLDDLGFDLDKLSATSSNSIETLSSTDHPADAPTMVAGLDDRSRAMLRDAEQRTRPDLAPTRELPAALGSDDATQLAPAFGRKPAASTDASATGTVRALGTGDLDLDLDELARALENDTIEQPRRTDFEFSSDVFAGAKSGAARVESRSNGHAANAVDLDVGLAVADRDREPTVTERINTDDLALPELEPVTLSEVGTKLDLARAYMDMGDPDGARSILQEVLGEGSASQKQEAQRLIETLPG
jgi:pilus assembly protein FimV